MLESFVIFQVLLYVVSFVITIVSSLPGIIFTFVGSIRLVLWWKNYYKSASFMYGGELNC